MRAPGFLLLAAVLAGGVAIPWMPPTGVAMATIIRDGAARQPDKAASVGGERPVLPARVQIAIPVADAWLCFPGTSAAAPWLALGRGWLSGPADWWRAAAAWLAITRNRAGRR